VIEILADGINPKTGDVTGIGRLLRSMLGYRRNRKIVFSASAAVLQRIVLVGSTLFLTPLLLRVLGAANFGIWAAATSIGWFSGLADLGTGSALVTLVARSTAAGRSEEARAHVESALTVGGALATLVLAASTLALFVVPRSVGMSFLIAIVALAVNAPLNVGNNVWQALQKGYLTGLWEAIQTVLTVAGLITVTHFTTDVRVYVAVLYGAMILANCGSLIHLLIAHPELRPRTLPVPFAAVRGLAGQGFMFLVLGIVGNFSYMLDNVLALALLGPEASARMAIALRVCITAVSILGVMSQPLWPAFADAAENADRQWIGRTMIRGMAFLVGLAAIGSSILVVFGERLLRWWLHSALEFGPFMLWTMAIWMVVQALSRVPSLLLNGLSLIRFQIIVCTIGTVIAFVLKFVLVRRIGIAGVMWGTTITAFSIVIPANLWRIHRWSKTAAHLPHNSPFGGLPEPVMERVSLACPVKLSKPDEPEVVLD
jgi:O-antigen/teichoic acid export membrane protein